MAVIQISKIQLRRGLETEFTPSSLDLAEFGFAKDTGRLFIGVDDSIIGPWPTRTDVPPYGNIEILTEAALQTFARMFDRFNRSLGPIGVAEGSTPFLRRPFFEGDMPISSSWTVVNIKTIDQTNGALSNLTNEPFVLAQADSCGGKVEYFLLSGGTVVRTGIITVLHNGDGAVDQAQSTDEYVVWPTVSGGGDPIPVEQLYSTGIEFRANRISTGPDEYSIQLEYKNTTSGAVTIQLRASIAADITP